MLKNLFKKLFKNSSNSILKIVKKPVTTINGYFGHTDYTPTLIEYNGKKITYKQLEKYLFKYMDFDNDPKLHLKMIEDEECKIVFPVRNINRIIDYKNIIDFLEKYDFKEYFKDWVKQAEHPEIKKFAWLLAQKGFLEKKKEKNRVYYKFKKELDYNILFDELFESKQSGILLEVHHLIDYIADEECKYIEIRNSCFDKSLIGIYTKLDTPIFKGCSYLNIYVERKLNNINLEKYKTLKDILEEIVASV